MGWKIYFLLGVVVKKDEGKKKRARLTAVVASASCPLI